MTAQAFPAIFSREHAGAARQARRHARFACRCHHAQFHGVLLPPGGALPHACQRIRTEGPARRACRAGNTRFRHHQRPLADEKTLSTAAYDGSRFWKVDVHRLDAFYPGTGDAFASVLTGSLLQGDSLPVAVDRAVQFVVLGIRATFGYATPHTDGMLLERALPSLHRRDIRGILASIPASSPDMLAAWGSWPCIPHFLSTAPRPSLA